MLKIGYSDLKFKKAIRSILLYIEISKRSIFFQKNYDFHKNVFLLVF